MRSLAARSLTAALLAGGLAAASAPDAETLALAREEAAQAAQRSHALERRAEQASGAAERARARGEALAARIQAAEANLTAAEARIAIVRRLLGEQRARLAERQAPVVKLTAALQTMARRPPALALVRPGSIDDLVHVRAVLASVLPEIRRRTAALSAEVARTEALQREAGAARQALLAGRTTLQERRATLARFEAESRARSGELTGLALAESDRALAFGEEARALARLIGTREQQARIEARLAALPGPAPRPGAASTPPRSRRGRPAYLLPVEGRVVTGVGEISEAGVHARGVTFETEPGARVIAPADGRVVYADRFRSYGRVVILDHGGGWTSVITDLAALGVRPGQRVRRGAVIGSTPEREAQVTVELRKDGRPVPPAQFVAG